MTIQIYELLPVLFDYDINVGEPQLGKVVVGYDDYGRAIYSEEGYTLKTTVSVKRNANTHLFYNILTNTFKSLSLSSDEITEYEKTRIETYPLALYIAPPTERHGMNDSRRQLFEKYKQEYRFRSDAWQEEFADFFNVGLAFATFNFQIKLINNPDNISEIGLFNEREIQSHADKLLDVSDLKLMTRGYIAPLLRNHGDAKIYVPSFNKISEHWIEFSNFHYCSVLSKTTQLNEVADTNNKKKNREKKDKPSLLSRFAEGVEVNGSPLSSRQTQSMQTAQSVRVTSTQSIDLFDEKYDVLFTESFTLFIPKNEISSIQGFEIKRIP